MKHYDEHNSSPLFSLALEFSVFARDAEIHLLQGQDYPALRLKELASALPIRIAKGIDAKLPLNRLHNLGLGLTMATEINKLLYFCQPQSMTDEIRLVAGRELIAQISALLRRSVHFSNRPTVIATDSGSYKYAA